ncbi:hypothetical protein SPHINGO8BC_51123 [Sphingobacterium multivorum]|uniref:Uncharacterized protein n=1 Tax=Sphingobacterium multivorum TaxID=28454 RepID=A0A654CRK4_SPHMU|nr:hypothetical protein SPHINGO8BC_51123 [Sphingobacterium multivorum]
MDNRLGCYLLIMSVPSHNGGLKLFRDEKKNIVFNAECFHVSRFRLLQVSGH